MWKSVSCIVVPTEQRACKIFLSILMLYSNKTYQGAFVVIEFSNYRQNIVIHRCILDGTRNERHKGIIENYFLNRLSP